MSPRVIWPSTASTCQRSRQAPGASVAASTGASQHRRLAFRRRVQRDLHRVRPHQDQTAAAMVDAAVEPDGDPVRRGSQAGPGGGVGGDEPGMRGSLAWPEQESQQQDGAGRRPPVRTGWGTEDKGAILLGKEEYSFPGCKRAATCRKNQMAQDATLPDAARCGMTGHASKAGARGNAIILAQPRGFCAGVVRAIEIVERALEKYGAAGLCAPRDRAQQARGREPQGQGRPLRRGTGRSAPTAP